MHSKYFDFVTQVVSLICVIVVTFILWFWKDSLITVPQLTNPIKFITRVLNYARNHNYPENRSALTYWEEEHPSCIDLGMSKYGGPFSVEEVEDVKTIFRLIPLILQQEGAMLESFFDWFKLLIGVALFEDSIFPSELI